jgi:hypothetical protein
LQNSNPPAAESAQSGRGELCRCCIQGSAAFVILGSSVVFAWCAVELHQSSADSRLVVRISEETIQRLAPRRVHERLPIQEAVGDFIVTGVADAVGDVSITLEPTAGPQGEAVFVIRVAGRTLNTFEAQCSPVRILATGEGTFTVEKRLRFDGMRITGDKAVVSAVHETKIGKIDSLPGAEAGTAMRLLAAREVRRSLPQLNARAARRIEETLRQRIDETLRQTIHDLDALHCIHRTAQALHPGKERWRICVTRGDGYVQASLVPAGGRLPRLPKCACGGCDEIDVWVRLSQPERMGLDLLSRWQDSGETLKSYLPPGAPSEIVNRAQMTHVGEWTRLRLESAFLPAVKAAAAPESLLERTL